jgi:hypothetical protein
MGRQVAIVLYLVMMAAVIVGVDVVFFRNRFLACACFRDNQFPTRMPVDLTLFTRAMPAASSSAISPLSAASAASLRIADIRMMIDDEPRRRASSDARQALTLALRPAAAPLGTNL